MVRVVLVCVGVVRYVAIRIVVVGSIVIKGIANFPPERIPWIAPHGGMVIVLWFPVGTFGHRGIQSTRRPLSRRATLVHHLFSSVRESST